jgi:hypothetical protein
MQYHHSDPRAHDPVGRIAWLRTIADEADMISRVLEQHARETDNKEIAAYLARLATATRDFSYARHDRF